MKKWLIEHRGIILGGLTALFLGGLAGYADEQHRLVKRYDDAMDKCINRGKWLKENHPDVYEEMTE